jgi:hypothetical protein
MNGTQTFTRVLIQSNGSREFLGNSLEWTKDSDAARDFGNASAAAQFIDERGLDKVHLVFKSVAEGYEVITLTP